MAWSYKAKSIVILITLIKISAISFYVGYINAVNETLNHNLSVTNNLNGGGDADCATSITPSLQLRIDARLMEARTRMEEAPESATRLEDWNEAATRLEEGEDSATRPEDSEELATWLEEWEESAIQLELGEEQTNWLEEEEEGAVQVLVGAHPRALGRMLCRIKQRDELQHHRGQLPVHQLLRLCIGVGGEVRA